MKWHFRILLAVLTLSAVWSPPAAYAASQGIASTVYPSGAHISYQPVVSNQEMDCLWGFFCEGNVPLFHFQTQDQLHRLSGWAQFAGFRHGRAAMNFGLFTSQYPSGTDVDGTLWSKAAFDDLISASHAKGYRRLFHQPQLVSASPNGGSIAEVQHWGSSELVVVACWSQTQEVEATVAVDHASPRFRNIALRDLVHQVVWNSACKL